MKKFSLFVLRVVFCLCLINRVAEGGRLPEDWDALPQIESFAFWNEAIGLVSTDHSYFLLNTKAGTLKQISEREFKRRFSTLTERAAEVINNTGIGSEVRLRTSGGHTFYVTNAYCSEGQNITHRLSLNGKPLKDFVRPCHSVSAVEVVGDQLWLGTRADAEYGDYPAEGIIIQSLDGKKEIGQISTKNGLTGDLVRTIRLNPVESRIWVATNQGINAISKNLKIEKSFYFYQDFDPATGKPIVLASPQLKKNPAVVEFARQLHLADYKSFHSTLQTIPSEAIDKLMNGMRGLYAPANALIEREAFAPEDVNKLVPFFIEASRSSDEMTKELSFTALCATNDPRAIARFVELRSKSQRSGGIESDLVPRCLDKYASFKLLPKDNTSDLSQELKADIQMALNTISTARANPSAPGQPMQVVVQNAISLNKMGDSSGMDLINEYFEKSDGNDRDASFYEHIGQYMTYENGISRAMVEGLQKFHTHDVSRGCMYFDMRWKFMPRRFDAVYAKAILTAVSHAMMTASPLFWSRLAETCTAAFKSQLDEPATKKAFVENIYGTLSTSEKLLADQMASGKRPY